ncbi:MAG: alpha/beta hydrolase fold [Ilumatobacteraceae bacterium]|nr:alpha/beta hydrolase fold [Ilumatobacteraceae bacterium]
MPSEHLNGIDVYYERSGVGRPLLFINGSGSTLAAARPLLGVFTTQFDVLAHDQRGLGLTSVPEGPYTMAEYAADAAALAEAIGWERYSVVGVSFGGMVAQELAVTFPQRIDRLALICTSSGGAGGASYPLHTLADRTDAERAEIGRLLLDTRFTPEWLADHDGDRALAAMMGDRTSADKPAEVLRGERLQLEARSHHDVFDRLANITSPTIVASGRFDGIAPPANGEAIASQIPDARFEVYEGGHAFFIQDRRAFPDVVAFLAG